MLVRNDLRMLWTLTRMLLCPVSHTYTYTQDGGDPDVEVSPRDIVFTLTADAAAAGAPPLELARTDMRCGGVAWCDEGARVLACKGWGRTCVRRLCTKFAGP